MPSYCVERDPVDQLIWIARMLIIYIHICTTRSEHFEANKKVSSYILGYHGKMMENNPELFGTLLGSGMYDEIRLFYTWIRVFIIESQYVYMLFIHKYMHI